jgi:5'-nucleotidase
VTNPTARQLGVLAIAATLLPLLLLARSPAAAQEARRRVLVTNDDGADSSALAALVDHLSKSVEVIVVAPAEDRSFAGRSKTIPSGMLRAREIEIPGASLAYAIEGTPVDAVQFGIRALGVDHPFDAVVAGINQGSALGSEATSIGVVGAALEAAALGLPAIAVTQDRRAHVFDVSANLTLTLLESWLAKGLPEGIALSINVPGSAADRPRGVVVARLGQPEYVVGGFHRVESADPRQLWRIQWNKVRRPERETDLEWYQRGEITITPLRWDATATDVVPALTEWAIQAPERAPVSANPGSP